MNAKPLFLTMASILALTACAAGGNTSSSADVPAEPAHEAEAALPGAIVSAPPPPMTTMTTPGSDADVLNRLARLEADMGTMKTQMSSIGPILEKMPALQDKLTQLVTELQRIDARVASAQPVTPPQAPVTSAPMMGMSKTTPTPAPKPAPSSSSEPTVLTPMVKPPAPKALETPSTASTEELLDKPPVTTKPTTLAAVPVTAASETTPVKTDGGVNVQAVRIGDASDKTRIVLDISDKTTFTTDLDNSEKILIVDLDATQFSAVHAAEFPTSPMIASYEADIDENGKARMIIQLKKSAKIISNQNLAPNGDKGNRIVIDIAPAQ